MKKILLVVLTLLFWGKTCCLAQGMTADYTKYGDSISMKESYFRPQQLIVPAALIMVGSFGISNGWLCKIKGNVRDEWCKIRGNCYFGADDYLQYFPLVAGVGLGLTGVKARHPLRERVCVTATASAVMALMVNVTKYSVGERRPDTDARNSYPSGHTATAFMGAEIVRTEYGNVYGVYAYAFSSGIALLRLYNDRHWLNDVLGGAGIGILSARIGYWLLPYERRLFGWDKRGIDAAIIPACNPVDGGIVSLSFTARF